MSGSASTRAAVCTGVLLLTLVGCDGGDEPPEPTARIELATSLSTLPAYCTVQGLRELIADGEVDISDLPEWADTTEVDGTPRVIDYSTDTRDGSSSAQQIDRLFFSSQGLESSVRIPGSYISTCQALTTDADIVRTQGALGYEAESGATAPDPAPAYPVPSLGNDLGGYCQVQHLRDLLADGQIDVDWLPAEADTTEVDGTPRIIDYTTAPESTLGHYEQLDEILDALRLADEDMPSKISTREANDALRECVASTTEADVERTQGAHGHAAG